MSDELVERLAVVICESDTVQPMGWEDVTAHWQDNYRTQARAVLDALTRRIETVAQNVDRILGRRCPRVEGGEIVTAADVIAAALTQHTTVSFPDRVAAAILDALKGAGWELVKLPEPDDGGPDEDGQLYFEDYSIRVDNTGSQRPGDIYTEVGLLRGEYNVRPMTDVESNLMTQVLDLRRQKADLEAAVHRVREACAMYPGDVMIGKARILAALDGSQQ